MYRFETRADPAISRRYWSMRWQMTGDVLSADWQAWIGSIADELKRAPAGTSIFFGERPNELGFIFEVSNGMRVCARLNSEFTLEEWVTIFGEAQLSQMEMYGIRMGVPGQSGTRRIQIEVPQDGAAIAAAAAASVLANVWEVDHPARFRTLRSTPAVEEQAPDTNGQALRVEGDPSPYWVTYNDDNEVLQLALRIGLQDDLFREGGRWVQPSEASADWYDDEADYFTLCVTEASVAAYDRLVRDGVVPKLSDLEEVPFE